MNKISGSSFIEEEMNPKDMGRVITVLG